MDTSTLLTQLRKGIIGAGTIIPTPFGERLLTYADYTASGRGLAFIEDYISHCLKTYGNTHTEDDITGALSTDRLHRAEKIIKQAVHADANYVIIETGAGATGAVHYLQEILGIYRPPAGKEMYREILTGHLGQERYDEYYTCLSENRPVVFVGPYEHHSNEISWRECFAEVVEVSLDSRGFLDLRDLEEKLSRSEYTSRMKIGSFSAASNVTGLKSPVHDIAAILHSHNALAFFDFAASAPYVEIDMHRDEKSFFDGIFFSPHKFLGGPGSSGILIIHKRIYHPALPPTIAGGGTVDYVSATTQEYSRDIEAREKAGTPGILQIYRAALAMDLKMKLGTAVIESMERNIFRLAMEELSQSPCLELVSPMDEEHHLPIFSFNISCGNSHLHPRFVVKLLNDLFGIQARAGCSCAGPYGHQLLHIGKEISERYHKVIMNGNLGLKPGWTRVSFHYLMDEDEALFICRAIRFVAEYGKYFLPLYSFDIHSGSWHHNSFTEGDITFGIDDALTGTPGEREASTNLAELTALRQHYLEEAEGLSKKLSETYGDYTLKTTQADLISFIYT